MNTRLNGMGVVRKTLIAGAMALGIAGGVLALATPALAGPPSSPSPTVTVTDDGYKGGDHKPKIKVDVTYEVECIEGECKADVRVEVCNQSKRLDLKDLTVKLGTTKLYGDVGKNDCHTFEFPGVPNDDYKLVVYKEHDGQMHVLWEDKVTVDCEKTSPSPSPSITASSSPSPSASISTSPVGQQLPNTGTQGGSPAPVIAGTGAVLLLGGVALVLVLRRRRDSVRIEA